VKGGVGEIPALLWDEDPRRVSGIERANLHHRLCDRDTLSCFGNKVRQPTPCTQKLIDLIVESRESAQFIFHPIYSDSHYLHQHLIVFIISEYGQIYHRQSDFGCHRTEHKLREFHNHCISNAQLSPNTKSSTRAARRDDNESSATVSRRRKGEIQQSGKTETWKKKEIQE